MAREKRSWSSIGAKRIGPWTVSELTIITVATIGFVTTVVAGVTLQGHHTNNQPSIHMDQEATPGN